MNIFDHNIEFSNTGELYAGIKLGFINNQEALEFCEKGQVGNCSKDRFIDLYLSQEESSYAFLEKLKSFLEVDGLPTIETNGDYNGRKTDNLPDIYLRIWKLEMLLSALKSSEKKADILEKVYEYFYRFNFPVEWNDANFLIYGAESSSFPTEHLFDNLKEYLSNEINFFKNKRNTSIK